MRRAARFLPLLPLLAAPAASAATWHVLPDGTGDAPTIQAAVDSSAAGDSVLVAAGTYLENVVTEPGRVLIGSWDQAFTQWDVELHPTTVDGDSAGACITADFDEEDPDGRISGFHLVNGSGYAIGPWDNHGGGLYAKGLGKVSDCIVEECTAQFGAGLYVDADTPELANLIAQLNTIAYLGGDGGGLYLRSNQEGRVTRSRFESNRVNDYTGDDRGVGLFVTGGRVQVDSCTVSGNGRYYAGSGASSYGSGIYADCDSLILLDCEITRNRELSQNATEPAGTRTANYGGCAGGGGVSARTARIERCRITRNGAKGYDSASAGGISLDSGLIADCLIADNAAWGMEYDGSGGGISGGDITVRGCRVERNWTFGGTAWGLSGGIGASVLRISNTTVRRNTSFGGSNARSAGISAGSIDADNITVYRNSASAGSWGSNVPHVTIGIQADSGTVTHSIISGNRYTGPTPQVTGGLGGALESRHNLFWDNTGDDHADLLVAEHHVYAEPLFADSLLHLALHSPSIDRGDPAILDPDGSRSDLGAFGGPGADMAQPPHVAGLSAIRTPTGIALEWDSNGAPDLAGYAIYRLPSPDDHPSLENFLTRTTDTTFLDPVGPAHPRWYYRVSAYDLDDYGGGYSAPIAPSKIGDLDVSTALAPELRPVTPNPTRGAVAFEFVTQVPLPARIEVFDVGGRRIWSGEQRTSAGTSRLEWPGRDSQGRRAAPGQYFLRIRVGDRQWQRKVLMVR